MLQIFLSLLLVIAAVCASGRGREQHSDYDWELTAGIISPDGFKRSAELVNAQFPGPTIVANKGDRIQVNLKNSLFDPTMRRSTSIHWHGIFQPRNAQNDGTSFVSQCPIAQNQTFLYTIIPNEQAGTFWYHSHLSTQYIDGIRGPIVIYDPDDPQKHLYDVDNLDTIITLADWYHTSALNSTNAFLAGAGAPNPDSGLVNGIGRFSGGPEVPWARINVEQGKRYRLRLINMAAVGQFEVQLANHSMTVIEADGIEHVPYTVDSIPILAGQRYSVVVTANQTVDNYWFSANMSSIQPGFPGVPRALAVLHYEGASHADPTVPPPNGLSPGEIEFKEFNLEPLKDPGAPGGDRPADQVFNFTFRPDIINAPKGSIWLINNIQYQPPSVPTLLNILANGFTNESQFGHNEHTLVLKPKSVVEVSFIGGAGHAFHLHGHDFDVIQSASGGPPNYKNPPRRDVVASGGTMDNPVRIRFKTDNPGPWMVHCHIAYHLVAGLAAVFAEDPAGIQHGPQSIHPNKQWEQLCNIYNSLPPALQ